MTTEDRERSADELASDVAGIAGRIASFFAGATAAQAAGAIAICDVISPLLIRSSDPRAALIGGAIRVACRFRRRVRGRT